MTDYAQITNFTAKDALNTGDPLKAVKGSDIDAEFAAISTAILSKYDSDNLATQAEAEAGSENTKVMTPLRVQQLLDAIIFSATKAKTATETVNNSTTLQDDEHITGLSLTAGATYLVFGVLSVALKAASDIKLLLVASSAPSVTSIGYQMNGATAGGISATQADNSTAAALASAGSDETVSIFVFGFITAGSAATLKLQWAQNSAVAEDTVMNVGSFVTALRVN
jgi:hypothetical protein